MESGMLADEGVAEEWKRKASRSNGSLAGEAAAGEDC